MEKRDGEKRRERGEGGGGRGGGGEGEGDQKKVDEEIGLNGGKERREDISLKILGIQLNNN